MKLKIDRENPRFIIFPWRLKLHLTKRNFEPLIEYPPPQIDQFMKLFFTSIVLLFLTLTLQAELSVKSFRLLPSDLVQQVPNGNEGLNSIACLKVITSIKGIISFDCGQQGLLKTVFKDGEVLVYIPIGSKQLTISHPTLGVVRNYQFPLAIQKAQLYELTLGTEGAEKLVVEGQTSNPQWLSIKPIPATANIYIDKVLVRTGNFTGRYKPGIYSYSVEAPLFHTATGTIVISDKDIHLDVQLESASGFIAISSTPEDGANVMIDGKLLDQLTPCKSPPLSSGEHVVQLLKAFHKQEIQNVTVQDDKTTPAVFNLTSNFATLTLKTLPNAVVIVNGEVKETGKWSGRLNAGIYSIEAQLEKHRSVKEEVALKVGENKELSLHLIPITSSLLVNSSPSGAEVMIDGKDFGITPITINNLLIGDYNVALVKQGYAPCFNKATLLEGEHGSIHGVLTKGQTIIVKTDPLECNIMIDGTEVGKSPYLGMLSNGNHTISAHKNKSKVEKNITISSEGGETVFELSLAEIATPPTVLKANLKPSMVLVKGGSFLMGSILNPTGEQLSSSPEHEVTVDDFYLQTTETTQLLWKSVMGVNPSKFQGDNLPVDDISWDDVQKFILKLNKLTGNVYRLPTEAEWEYAASGGKGHKTKYAGTDFDSEVVYFAWTEENSNGGPHPVGTKKPNKLGLYDMTGNVWEWCSDWLGLYPSEAQINPVGPSSGVRKANRGGAWKFDIQSATNYRRGGYDPTSYNNRIGFRLAMSVVK